MQKKAPLVGCLAVLVIFFTGCRSNKESRSRPLAATAYSDEGYKLVWSDEFTADGPPDSKNWRFEKGFVRNEEAQWYQEENAYCRNGRLVIEARRENKPNPLYAEGSRDWRKKKPLIEYSSASLNTSGRHNWQYGRFVMGGKIDISGGLWPAWWTLGTNGRWPANGEIDIMEYYREKLLANIAHSGLDGKVKWHSNTLPVDSLGGEKWASRFHVWRMDWDEHSIALYVDDRLLNRVAVDDLVNKDDPGVNPFRQPHYMLLDLAMGGLNGGEILPSTKFPNRFEIDYVRVYQKSE